LGREVRPVAIGWEHPRRPGTYSDGSPRYRPLHSREDLRLHLEDFHDNPGDWEDGHPDLDDYMPPIPEGHPYQFMLYETTSEGSPLSPAFGTLEELAAWCEVGATAFGGIRWTREQWLASFKDGTTDVDTMLVGGPSGLGTARDVLGPVSADG
jgi:hypothetical protein